MRIISGIQPTGSKHLGNFIGAIRRYVSYQDQGDAYYFIADMHALSVLPDPAELRNATISTVAMLLAAGLDPERCLLFVQSHVGAEHAQLAWMLGCTTQYGELKRMTQFKDKSEGKGEAVSVGLFTYPVLQVADIVMYDIDVVPVGEDQKQHIELARNVAQRFNNRYGETFTVPEPRIPKVGGRVMDLQYPDRKMSTTGGIEKGTVFVLDEAERVVKKFKSAVTDSGSEVYAAPDKPGITNLLEIMHIATGREIADIEDEYRDSGYGTFKVAAGEAVAEFLRPVRERYHELMNDPGEIERILAAGANRARERAAVKVELVKDRMGLLPAADRVTS
jgi:tryptophanyl-tRNA synthetase